MDEHENIVVRWLYRKAVANSEAWVASLPRYLLGSFSNVGSDTLAPTYAFMRWQKMSPTINKIRKVLPVMVFWDMVWTRLYVDASEVSNATTNHLASTEVEFWLWYQEGQKRDEGGLKPDVVRGAYKDEFLRLVHIIDNPEWLPYWEAGITDDSDIRSFIDGGVDVELAKSLLAD